MASTEFDSRAREHAPRTVTELRQAARQMILDGHSELSVAEVLRLDLDGLRRLIGDCMGCQS